MEPLRIGRSGAIVSLLTLMAMVFGTTAPTAHSLESGSITVTTTWADGQEPGEVVEFCFRLSSDVAGLEILGEACTSDESYSVRFGPALETGVNYFVREVATSPWEVTGNNPIAVSIPKTTGEAFVSFENQPVDEAYLVVQQFVCPPGFVSEQPGDYRAACQTFQGDGVEMSATGPDDRFQNGTTDSGGQVVFAGYTVAGEVMVAEGVPTGDFVDFVVHCSRINTDQVLKIDYRTNGHAAFAVDLTRELVDGDAGVLCEWFNIPPTTPGTVTPDSASGQTLTINPSQGQDGELVTYKGDGYTPGAAVVVLMTGDGLIVAETSADGNGMISGTFQAPVRDQLTGETTNDIPVFAIDQATGRESARTIFTYLPPAATPPPMAGRPVHIHAGTCARLETSPRFNLTDLTTPVAGSIRGATVVETSFTVVDLSLDELLGQNFAINVHPSHGEMRPFVACGEIGGPIRTDGSVVIGLREQNSSGLSGVADLRPVASHPDQTQVTVFLASGLAEEDPTLLPLSDDAEVIHSVVTNGPVSPEFQAGYEITIYGDGRVQVIITPQGASPALPDLERTADAEFSTVQLTDQDLAGLLAEMQDVGFFQLTQVSDVAPDDVLIGGSVSIVTVTLMDGTWQVDANGLPNDQVERIAQVQQIILDAIGLDPSGT